MQSADMVVIGSGIIGSSTAYYLAKTGADVVLVDRAGPNTGGTASQACAGGVRQQGRVPEEIPLSIYAIGLWAGLETELEADLHYRRDGMTVMTDDEDRVPLHNFRFETPLEGLFVSGSVTGVEGSEVAQAQGRMAGLVSAGYLGLTTSAVENDRITKYQAAISAARKKAIAFLPDIESGRDELLSHSKLKKKIKFSTHNPP